MKKSWSKLSGRALDLLSVKYQTAWMEVFTALSALFDALRWRGDPYLLPIVKSIGELRGNDGFQGKERPTKFWAELFEILALRLSSVSFHTIS